MRILHITTNYPTAEHPAFGSFVRSQVESLRAAGSATDSLRSDEVECEVFYINGRVHGKGTVGRYLAETFRLLWHLLRHRYDVLHCHHALAGLVLCLTLAPLFSRTVLSYQNELSHELGRPVFYLLYPFFRRIIFKSSVAAPTCRKVRVLPNGCDDSLFYPRSPLACKQALSLSQDKQYILYVDSNLRARRQKREDRFDAVVARLQTEFPQVEALKLRNEAPEKMPLYYNAAALYLLCSDFEGSPNAVKECLMCNVPVVATSVGDVPFLAQHCPDCHVIEASEACVVEALSDLAASVLRSEAASSREATSSREALLSLGYGLTSTAHRLLHLYQEIQ